MTFEVIFKYRDNSPYPLDLKKAPNTSLYGVLSTGLYKSSLECNPHYLVASVPKLPSIKEIMTAFAAATALITATVAMVILFPNIFIVVTSLFAIIAVGGGFGLISNRKKAFKAQEKCREQLNELGKLIGDQGDRIRQSVDKELIQELDKLENFFFPKK